MPRRTVEATRHTSFEATTDTITAVQQVDQWNISKSEVVNQILKCAPDGQLTHHRLSKCYYLSAHRAHRIARQSRLTEYVLTGHRPPHSFVVHIRLAPATEARLSALRRHYPKTTRAVWFNTAFELFLPAAAYYKVSAPGVR